MIDFTRVGGLVQQLLTSNSILRRYGALETRLRRWAPWHDSWGPHQDLGPLRTLTPCPSSESEERGECRHPEPGRRSAVGLDRDVPARVQTVPAAVSQAIGPLHGRRGRLAEAAAADRRVCRGWRRTRGISTRGVRPRIQAPPPRRYGHASHRCSCSSLPVCGSWGRVRPSRTRARSCSPSNRSIQPIHRTSRPALPRATPSTG